MEKKDVASSKLQTWSKDEIELMILRTIKEHTHIEFVELQEQILKHSRLMREQAEMNSAIVEITTNITKLLGTKLK